MAKQNNDRLSIVAARRGTVAIETDVPTSEIASMVDSGTVVVVKDAVDPGLLREMRAAILESGMPDSRGEIPPGTGASFRIRREDYAEAKLRGTFDTYYFNVVDSGDSIGQKVRGQFGVLANFWRALTGLDYDFTLQNRDSVLHPWAMHYPVGGGWLDWHVHPPGPTKIGIVLALSEYGVDFFSGGTEIQTPAGIVDTTETHDIGDICLFRYDLPHRVAPVDPDRQRCWDGTGRWTLILPARSIGGSTT